MDVLFRLRVLDAARVLLKLARLCEAVRRGVALAHIDLPAAHIRKVLRRHVDALVAAVGVADAGLDGVAQVAVAVHPAHDGLSGGEPQRVQARALRKVDAKGLHAARKGAAGLERRGEVGHDDGRVGPVQRVADDGQVDRGGARPLNLGRRLVKGELVGRLQARARGGNVGLAGVGHVGVGKDLRKKGGAGSGT